MPSKQGIRREASKAVERERKNAEAERLQRALIIQDLTLSIGKNPQLIELRESIAVGNSEVAGQAIQSAFEIGVEPQQVYDAMKLGIYMWRTEIWLDGILSNERER